MAWGGFRHTPKTHTQPRPPLSSRPPTGGAARYSGGLSVFNFLRIRTWLRLDDPSLVAADVEAAPSSGNDALAPLDAPHLLARGAQFPARAAHDRLLIGHVLPIALMRLLRVLGERPLEARAPRPAYHRVGVNVRRGEADVEAADLRQQT